MKKIKISELPLYQSLKGLFVMGTDVNNRSVKVNLEFIETETTEAVKQAQAAVSAAEIAAGLANNATKNASDAAKSASEAKQKAEQAAKSASDAASFANNSALNAENATNTANAAAQAAQKAKQDADAATKAAQEATEAADEATEAAEKATEKVLDTLGMLVPTGLKAECLSRLTIGNVEPIYIKTELTPETAMKNLIFISTGDAVEVGQDGRLTPVRKGYSHVHVIPTCNTALAQSFLIEVGEPTVRLVRSNAIRFTQSGAFRMN